jgi:hypothetical protein
MLKELLILAESSMKIDGWRCDFIETGKPYVLSNDKLDLRIVAFDSREIEVGKVKGGFGNKPDDSKFFDKSKRDAAKAYFKKQLPRDYTLPPKVEEFLKQL